VLEFDELRLFTQLPGLEVFSPGAYLNPQGLGDRPPIPELNYKPEWLDAWSRVPSDPSQQPPLSDQKAHLTKEFLDHFDAVYIQHVPAWVTNNWKTLEEWGGEVFYRDIGQCNFEQEQMLRYYVDRGLKIIRYSPKNRMVPNYAGEHALIRFSKDPDDFLPWVGDRLQVITIAQSMQDREPACGYELFLNSTRPFQRVLFGNNNQSSGPLWGGQLTYQRLIEQLSWSRCYWYSGTYPAPYTLNGMEAMFAGTPIVAIGPKLARFPHYEVADLLEDWGLGDWVGESTHDLENLCRLTLSMGDEEAKQRSDALRKGARETFSYEAVLPQWKELFRLC
jgi:hypothetical protein